MAKLPLLALVITLASLLASAVTLNVSADGTVPEEGGSEPPDRRKNVWMLPYNYTDIVYSKLTQRVLAVRPGGRVLDELDLVRRRIRRRRWLPFPTIRLGIGRSGRFVSIVYSSRICLLDVSTGKVTYKRFPMANGSQLMALHLAVDVTSQHATCAWLGQYVNNTYVNGIDCVNPADNTAATCDNSDAPSQIVSSTVWTDNGASIYELTPLPYIMKHSIDTLPSPGPFPEPKRCPRYMYTKYIDYGPFFSPNMAWLSYDQSAMFLDNGLALSVNTDPNSDLKVMRSLNGTRDHQFIKWVDQYQDDPYHEVVAIRRVPDASSWQTFRQVVERFSWPWLQAVAPAMEIPCPKNMAIDALKVRPQVHFGSSAKEIFVIANFLNSGGVQGPGIAFMSWK